MPPTGLILSFAVRQLYAPLYDTSSLVTVAVLFLRCAFAINSLCRPAEAEAQQRNEHGNGFPYCEVSVHSLVRYSALS